MTTFKLISDSSCDLPKEYIDKYDVTIVPFYISLSGTDYLREGVDISADEFYRRMRANNIFGKTSLPSISDYCDTFVKYLDEGQDILCFCLSSGLSGSYQSAVNASNLLRPDYPDRQIIIIDTQLVTTIQASLIISAAELREKGEQLSVIVKKVTDSIPYCGAFFTVDTLDYLQHGGRIGKVAALAGTLLNIKPIIVVKNGVLLPHAKARGRKKAMSELINAALNAIKSDPSKYNVAVLHADCYDEVLELKKTLANEHGIEAAYPIAVLSSTIGVHTGPSLIGITYNLKIT